MTKTDKVCAYMKLHPPESREVGYDKRVGKKFSCSPEWVRKLRRKMGLTGVIGNGYETVVDKTPAVLKDAVYHFLLKSRKKWSVEDLANNFDVGPIKVRQAVEELKAEAKSVNVEDGEVELLREHPYKPSHVHIDVSKFKDKHFKVGVTADNHLGSNYERMDVLNALYDIWANEGVTEVWQAGNMIDGEARFNKFDIHKHGIYQQAKYFAEAWPARKGIATKFIAGDDHEGWYQQNEGIDIGKYLEMTAKEMGRSDLIYLGYMEANILYHYHGNTQVVNIAHGGGGSAYAISYRSQKRIESLQGGEKPNIQILGNYHKFDIVAPRNVYTIQPGCTEDQTPFMRKKNLEAHVGGVTLEFDIGKDGLMHAIKAEWHPFYDRDFYSKQWKHLKEQT